MGFLKNTSLNRRIATVAAGLVIVSGGAYIATRGGTNNDIIDRWEDANGNPKAHMTSSGSFSASGSLSISGTLLINDVYTGGNAGTDACIDASGRLCACNSCE